MHKIIIPLFALFFAGFSPFPAYPSLQILLASCTFYAIFSGISIKKDFPISIHYIVFVLIIIGSILSDLFFGLQVKYYTYLLVIVLYIVTLSLFSSYYSGDKLDIICLAIFIGLSLPMCYGFLSGSVFELDRASIGVQGFSGNRVNFALYLSHLAYSSIQSWFRFNFLLIKAFSFLMFLSACYFGVLTSSRSFLLYLFPLLAYLFYLACKYFYHLLTSSSIFTLLYLRAIILISLLVSVLISSYRYIERQRYFEFVIAYSEARGWSGRDLFMEKINYFLDNYLHVYLFGTGGPDFLSLNSENYINLLDVGGISTLVLQFGIPGLVIVLVMIYYLIKLFFSPVLTTADKFLSIFCFVCLINPASNLALNYNTYPYYFAVLYFTLLVYHYRHLVSSLHKSP